MGYIYAIKNKVNDKVYVGQTINSLQDRWYAHKSKANHSSQMVIHHAMRKHGIENFYIELLEECDNLSERERFWIEHLDTYNNGYNLSYGGEGWGSKPNHHLNRKVRIVELDKEFDSIKDCAQYMIDNGVSNSTNTINVLRALYAVASGRRTAYHKYHIEYTN